MNKYTQMQKNFYNQGTSNHLEHDKNPDYWDILLGDIKDSKKWREKIALDFGCGKGRNVTNLLSGCEWERVDGVDISEANIDFCKTAYGSERSNWLCNNGTDLKDLDSVEYDFIMSTIVLQHIPVYDIRRGIFEEFFRVLKPDGLLSFQVTQGPAPDNPPPCTYYDNFYDAQGTNSQCDFRVTNPEDVVKDLKDIGFSEVSYKIRPSFSDSQHPNWLYIKAYKR